MSTSFKRATRFLLDLLFPITCLGCKAEGAWVCDVCVASIPRFQTYECLTCKEISTASMLCDSCFSDPSIDSISCFAPHTGVVRRMIHELKYKDITAIAPLCARLLTELPHLQDAKIITSVPLHRTRLRERGFNQAELIARHFAKQISMPFQHTLIRTRATKQQVGQSREERIKNISSAFIIMPNIHIAGLDILLIDDVFTTGATVSDAARALKNAGASSVHVFTVSHG